MPTNAERACNEPMFAECGLAKLLRNLWPVVHRCGSRPVLMLRTGLWMMIAALALVSRSPEAWWQGLLAALAVYIITGGWKIAYIFLRTAPRDLNAGIRYLLVRYNIYKICRKNETVPILFMKRARQHPFKPAYIFEDKVWTFKDVDELSNRVAHCFAKQGFRAGDVVALYMESCPEYVCMWLGLAKIGVCTALINFNLKDQPLIHSIKTAESKALIFGSELAKAVKDIQGPLNHDFQYYCYGDFDSNEVKAKPLSKLIQESPTYPAQAICNVKDKLLYIYTSGTTGLPKPAVIHHVRFIFMALSVNLMNGLSANDILYDALPLYHSAGGVLGAGQALLTGLTVVIRRKFSASKFWEDCIRYNCTAAQYIGEICRYLLSQPPRPTDSQHKVRVIFGNGLRPQIWKEFVKRFRIANIGEFYGSTEGNANISNTDSHPNAIGFVSRIAPWVYPVTLIRVDEATGEPIRDDRGVCIKCQPGEPGEFVGKIVQNDPARDFSGYVNKSATQKKIAHNVFRKGDAAFLSGDILVMDDLGYLYFKDRTGDTFRWRGENVSTSEVEAVISNIVGLKDCVVYGVEIPACEGRAGMATILDVDGTLDLEGLSIGMQRSLPTYAQPIFLRVVSELDMTGTYKLRKVDLQKKGFEINQSSKDQLFYLDASIRKYRILDQEIHDQIQKGKLRL